jgi:N-hydroxyarylamine O-acetyltransferase
MTEASGLNAGLVERVLEAFGLAHRPEPDLQGLCRLYAAWCRNVPFDNIRKLIAVRAGDPGRLPGDDPAEFFEYWLAHRVGGTCWAGNGALTALLDALGFAAHRGVATMMVAPDIPPNHGTVVVELPEGRYVIDASIMHVEPLPVQAGVPSSVDHPAWGVEGRWLGDKFAINWRPMMRGDRIDCRVDDWPVDAARFSAQHEATREWSPFNFELVFNLVRGNGRIGVGNGLRREIGADGELAVPFDDRVRFLVDACGVSEELARQLPDDVPTPPPPGSRTAAERRD